MSGRGVFVTLLLAFPVLAQKAASPVPLPVRRSLESIAQNLVRSGWIAEATTVVNVLQDLGHEQNAMTALRAALAKLEPKAPKEPTGGNTLAPAVVKAAASLAALLPAAGEHQSMLAQAIVKLDDNVADAQRLLGRVENGGRWGPPAHAARDRRRGEILAAVAQARRLVVDVKSEPGQNPLFSEALQCPSVRVRYGPLTVESVWPAEKVVRVVQTTVRALAVSRFLVEGKLALPDTRHGSLSTLHVASEARYQQAVAWLRQRGQIDEKGVDPLQVSGVYTKSEKFVHYHETEARSEASMLYDLLHGEKPACLLAGHVDWLCRTFLGEPIPGVLWDEKGGTPTAAGGGPQENTWRQHLPKAGLMGARSWLLWLASRSQDPPYSRCFVDQVGKLRGDELLKATFACEFFYESETFAKLWRVNPTSDFAAALKTNTGVSVAEFDAMFREWLVGSRRGLAQVLAARRAVPPDVRAALARLAELRRAAMAKQPRIAEPRPEPGLDDSLSDGARAHAEYLRRHPDQAAMWPGVSEEYPDREGFSTAGAWAAGHSLIASGVESMTDAIDTWMGSFYHRLPLLAPGLMQCGMAHVGDLAVLDAESLVIPEDHVEMVAIWPAADAKNVPLQFEPEQPEPVPGIDQTTLGYLITVQCGEHLLGGAELQMTLHDVAAGAVVECHWSTPIAPTNPERAPRAAWCLIPKAPLAPNKRYKVTCKLGTRDSLEWTFQTGAR